MKPGIKKREYKILVDDIEIQDLSKAAKILNIKVQTLASKLRNSKIKYNFYGIINNHNVEIYLIS